MINGWLVFYETLVCMAGITCVYIETIFAFCGCTWILKHFSYSHPYCLVGCLTMIDWTRAVLGVLYACVLYFCICTSSAQLIIFHMERRSRNTLIIIIIHSHLISDGRGETRGVQSVTRMRFMSLRGKTATLVPTISSVSRNVHFSATETNDASVTLRHPDRVSCCDDTQTENDVC